MLSVILPTIRPERILPVLINLNAQRWTVPLEVIVVADFVESSTFDAYDKPQSVRWLVRERRGAIDAIQAGYHAASGDVIFLTNDETMCRLGCLKALHDAAMARPDVLFTPVHEPYFRFQYYGKPFAAFPCGHRSLFDKLGGFLDPAYRAFYADPDLSMRAHAAGVPIEVVEGAVIDHHNAGDKSASWDAYFLQDRAMFRSRWDHLGVFHDP